MKTTQYTRAVKKAKKENYEFIIIEIWHYRLSICRKCERWKTEQCRYCCKGKWLIVLTKTKCGKGKW